MVRWVLAGGLFGLLWPIVAFTVAATHIGSWSVTAVHAAQPALWAAGFAPLVLAGGGALIGAAHHHLTVPRARTDVSAERMAVELSNEIHDGNVGVARTAALQTQFFAALSHNIRTPPSAIIGFSELGAAGAAAGRR